MVERFVALPAARLVKRLRPGVRPLGCQGQPLGARPARERDAAVMLIYGAHLLRNGSARIIERLLAQGWITHLATNGAGTIHDWEYAWFGASTESVEMNVASGTFADTRLARPCVPLYLYRPLRPIHD